MHIETGGKVFGNIQPHVGIGFKEIQIFYGIVNGNLNVIAKLRMDFGIAGNIFDKVSAVELKSNIRIDNRPYVCTAELNMQGAGIAQFPRDEFSEFTDQVDRTGKISDVDLPKT